MFYCRSIFLCVNFGKIRKMASGKRPLDIALIQHDEEGSSSNKICKLIGGSEDDEEDRAETESIIKIISMHAEHRGPKTSELKSALSAPGDNLARRYIRSKRQNLAAEAAAKQPSTITVSASYICHMCGERGHHIRQCPKKQGRRRVKKIRAATGIPRSWLKLITADQIDEFEDVYSLSSKNLQHPHTNQMDNLPFWTEVELRVPPNQLLCPRATKKI